MQRFYFKTIFDEAISKVDINKTPGILLKGLLTNLRVKDEDANIIVDSILDWKNPILFRRLNGAKDAYSMSLAVPYEAKNANF